MTDRPPLSRRDFARMAALAAVVPSLPGATAHAAGASALDAVATPDVPVMWPGYDRAIVIDGLATPGPFNVPTMFAAPYTASMVALSKTSGITAVNVTLSGSGSGSAAFLSTMRNIGFAEHELDLHGGNFIKVKTAGDIRRAKETGRLGLIFGFQDGTMLEDDVTRVELFQQLGVRIIQLTYNVRNLLGDGCLEAANAGLSGLGRRVVSRMNELGMLVDLSHVGERTTLDAIAHSAKPVAFTHSGCKAVNDVPRNKTDEQLKKLADKGGVIGIYMMPFLRASGPPTPDDLARHIEHAVQACGEDHVGIGSDLSISPLELTPEFRRTHADFAKERRRMGISAPGEAEDVYNYVPEFNTPRRLEQIADLLAKRGASSSRIEKILGANWLRLFTEVWG